METHEIPQIEKQNSLTNPSRLSRRNFLRLAGTATAGYLASRTPIIKDALKNVIKSDIDLNFFYEYHQDNETKLKRFKSLFDKADVFVAEFGPWEESTLEWFKDQEPDGKKINSPWEMVYGTDKPIFIIDPPKDNPLWNDLTQVEENMSPDYSLPFSQATKKMTDYLILEVDVHKKRESIWEEQLKTIMKTVQSSGEFLGRNSINVLIEAGAYHTSIYHKLSKQKGSGTKTHRLFSENPLTLPRRNEIMRRLLFKNQQPSPEDMQKVVLEAMLDDVYGVELNKKYTESPSEKQQYLRKITKKVSQDDIKIIFEQLSLIKNLKLPAEDEKIKMDSWFTSFLLEKGIQTK